jgi:hypothetical protein
VLTVTGKAPLPPPEAEDDDASADEPASSEPHAASAPAVVRAAATRAVRRSRGRDMTVLLDR